MSVLTKEELVQIITAAKNGDLETLNEIIITKEYNVNNICDHCNRPLLHISAEKGQVYVVKKLINLNADVDAVDEEGLTALHHASANGHTEVMEALTNAGASATATSKNRTTPLHRAAQGGKVEAITLLVEKYGVEVNVLDKDGNTGLHYAASGGVVSAVETLMKFGIEYHQTNINGSTPLHWASAYGKVEVIELLLKKGANCNATNLNGDAPIHRAAWWGHSKAVVMLVNHGADVNIANKSGDTALHKAAYMGQVGSIRTLIELRANSQSVNAHGNTALHVAVCQGEVTAVRELCSIGADTDIANKEGQTPFHMAVEKKRSDVVWYFVKETNVDIKKFDHEVQQNIDSLLEVKPSSYDHLEKQDAVDVDSIKAYHAAMKMGSRPSNQFKLVTLGAEGAGKTSTVNSLLSLPFQPNEESTDGAAVNSCIVEKQFSSVKWIKVDASFRVAEIPKLQKIEVKSVMSTIKKDSNFTVTPGPAEPIPQEVVSQVKEIVSSGDVHDGDVTKIVIFDIGGQEVYYEIHFMFLAEEDVALLVFDCSKGLDDPVISRQRTERFGKKISTRGMQSNIETIELLLHSVYSHGKAAPAGSISPRVPVVIMVGAHAEFVSIEEQEVIIQIICQRFDGKPFLDHLPRQKKDAFHFIGNSNPNPLVVNQLRKTVVKAATLAVSAERPITYLNFEGRILEKELQSKVRLKWQEAVKIAGESGVQGEQAVHALFQYCMLKGILLYYPEMESLKNEVFISPQEISDLVCTVITTHGCNPDTAKHQRLYKRYNQYALLRESLLDLMLMQLGRLKDKAVILGLLKKFNLAAEVPPSTKFPHEFHISQGEKIFMVPSLLVYDKKHFYHRKNGDIVVVHYFPDEFVPESIFNQLLVKTIYWCCQHNHLIIRIYRSMGHFCFEEGLHQQFQLQLYQSSIKCYITIQRNSTQMLPSDKLSILLEQRRSLIEYLESSIAEISRACIPSAEPPVTCLECPLHHDDNYTPHVPLNIKSNSVLICHEDLIATPVPSDSYLLLFQPIISPHQGATATKCHTSVQCSTSTATAYNTEKPRMKHLNAMVIPRIASHWRVVADQLDYEPEMIQVIDQRWRDPIQCCQDLMRDWLGNSNGLVPKTWETLVSTLKEIRDLTSVVETIEKDLSHFFSTRESGDLATLAPKKIKLEFQ